MKKCLLVGLMVALSAGVWADDKPMNSEKNAGTSQANAVKAGKDVPLNLRKTAEAIRAGTINVGKEYSLNPEEGRFHRVHASVLGLNDETVLDIKCGGCHSTNSYPDSYLYLRKFEFPREVGGEKVKAVQRHFCIGCHSGGSVSTVYYNTKK